MDDLARLHGLAKILTGDSWCPYPSERFLRVVLSIPQDQRGRFVATELIEGRRKFRFSTFLSGEPQEEALTTAEQYVEMRAKEGEDGKI